VRAGLATALIVSIVGSAMYRILLGPTAAQFAGVVGVIAVVVAAAVVCSATGNMLNADWMWATSARSWPTIGLAWWGAVGISSAVATSLVIVPVVVLLGSTGIAFTAAACLLASTLVGPVTKLVPWQHDNFASQVVASTALLMLLAASLQFVMWVGAQYSSPETVFAAVAAIVVLSLTVTLLSWRRWP
jgi:hypothetical protein